MEEAGRVRHIIVQIYEAVNLFVSLLFYVFSTWALGKLNDFLIKFFSAKGEVVLYLRCVLLID